MYFFLVFFFVIEASVGSVWRRRGKKLLETNNMKSFLFVSYAAQ
jgi:CBS domain containing-hemolysin-like protein